MHANHDVLNTICRELFINDIPLTFRGLFIIDDKGVLRQITMNDLPVGRSVDETLRLVQAFQFTDAHGEVCPAGWKPGDDTVSRHYLCEASRVITTNSSWSQKSVVHNNRFVNPFSMSWDGDPVINL